MTTKEKVKKLTHREHILHSPDTYVGSVEPTTDELWYYHTENKKMVKSSLTYVPGEYKLYDEIVVNSVDQYIRLMEMSRKNYEKFLDEATEEISSFVEKETIQKRKWSIKNSCISYNSSRY